MPTDPPPLPPPRPQLPQSLKAFSRKPWLKPYRCLGFAEGTESFQGFLGGPFNVVPGKPKTETNRSFPPPMAHSQPLARLLAPPVCLVAANHQLEPFWGRNFLGGLARNRLNCWCATKIVFPHILLKSENSGRTGFVLGG